ncbi:MAG TPA: acetylxylan esterase, partial [Pirellulales bacterium]|nr:acetylxylan esterase [Pirellulales bacterium]
MKMSLAVARCVLLLSIAIVADLASAQPLGEPDRAAPGDEMIQKYLARESLRLSAKYDDDLLSLEAWQAKRPQYVEEYFYMLGLSPRPEKTPLKATVTGQVKGEGYVVELMHYQSRPGLYVTGNLYRPAEIGKNQKLPAVLYVCG